jgi:hypothetical protein
MITKGKINLLKIIISISFISIVIFFQLRRKQLNLNAENCTEGKLELAGRNIIFHYSVNGINYQLKKKKSESYIIDGEKYRICYDINDPSTAVESFLHPIIDTSEFIEILSLPINANLRKGNEYVSFEYIFNNETFKRGHNILLSKEVSLKNERCKILVNKKNPAISYFKY